MAHWQRAAVRARAPGAPPTLSSSSSMLLRAARHASSRAKKPSATPTGSSRAADAPSRAKQRPALDDAVDALASRGDLAGAVALAQRSRARPETWRRLLKRHLRVRSSATSRESRKALIQRRRLALASLDAMARDGALRKGELTTVMSICIASDDAPGALAAFDAHAPALPDRDAHLYNTALQAALRVSEDAFDRALAAMAKESIAFDGFTYACLARSKAARGDAAGVRALLDDMPVEPMDMAKNALVQAHVRAGDADGALDAALAVFPDERTEETSRLLHEAFRHSSSMQASLEDLGFPRGAVPAVEGGVLDVRGRSVADAKHAILEALRADEARFAASGDPPAAGLTVRFGARRVRAFRDGRDDLRAACEDLFASLGVEVRGAGVGALRVDRDALATFIEKRELRATTDDFVRASLVRHLALPGFVLLGALVGPKLAAFVT